jgi:hypothetical protein
MLKRQAALSFIRNLRGIKYRIIETHKMGFSERNLTTEEILQREFSLKLASMFIIEYIMI